MDKIVLIPKKVILTKQEPMKHLFKCDDGFIVRDNSKWEIGNKYKLWLFH